MGQKPSEINEENKIVSTETVDFSIDYANNCTKGLSACYFILPLRPQTKN